jgi:predicted nucleic acid-binding Zn ribbon protein
MSMWLPVRDYNHTPFCPECNGEMRRKLSAVAIRFEGSGFYSTDYKKRPQKEESFND